MGPHASEHHSGRCSMKMTKARAINELTALKNKGWGDPERAHVEAERILMEFLRANGGTQVAKAYQECSAICRFNY